MKTHVGCAVLMGILFAPGIRGLPSYAQRAEPEYDLAFSTYLGADTEARDVAVDREGNVYVAGAATNAAFHTTPGAYQRLLQGGGNTAGTIGLCDVLVMKFTPDGDLVWSTLLGGPNYDRAYAIEVDSRGDVIVAGRAGDGFPTTPGVVQPAFAGDVGYHPGGLYGAQDGFVAKLSGDGSRLLWATYFGSADNDIIRDVAVDTSGNVYLGVTGTAQPVPHITPGAFQTKPGGGRDGVVAKLSADGTRVLYCSYIGGSGEDGETTTIRVDDAGCAYVLHGTASTDAPITPGALQETYAGGEKDMLLSKVSPDGSALIYSTYLGGSGYEGTETHGLWIDGAGNAHVSVLTNSPDLPVSATAYQKQYVGAAGDRWPWDGYVAKISPDGRTLLGGTYIGGNGREEMEGIAVDASGNVYVGGTIYTVGFPMPARAFQPIHAGGGNDAFFLVLSPDLSRVLYATYVGGAVRDGGRSLIIDGNGAVVICGESSSDDWPLKNALHTEIGGRSAAVIARFAPRR